MQSELEFYTEPGTMTTPGRHARLFDDLPRDLAALVRVVQGLTVHEYVASDFYGFQIPEDRKRESHLRRVEAMLDRLLEIDAAPLTTARPVEKRLVGVCHHPMLFLVAMLRAQGVPARARCGFGTYFNPDFYEDHWVCEYWNADEARWKLADPQFDDVWIERAKIDHDVLDVPRDRFLVAGDAWTQCRAGEADASKFGIFKGDLRGLWFIATDLVHDVAALNNMEMLPWDVWGACPKPNVALNDEQLEFFERLAALTRHPDAWFDDLQALYEKDDRVRVPPTVFNAVLNRPEKI
jgi:hypothetical protein